MRAAGLVAAGMATAAALGLVACWGGDRSSSNSRQNAARAPEPKRGGTLTMLWKSDSDSIDAGVTYSVSGALLARATQRMVLSFKPEDTTHPVPDLAAALPTVSRDGRTVTVKLRSGVRFSPPVNREVSSRDVKYGIERGFFRTVANPYVGIYFADLAGAKTGVPPGTQIRGIQTPDDHTVVFHLTKGTGRTMAGALVMPVAAPVPREYALRYDRRSPSTYGMHQVASGPYMFELDGRGHVTSYQSGKHIHLVRNPNWDRSTDFKPAYVDAIEIREGNDEAALATRRILHGHRLVSSDFTPPPAELKRALGQQPDQIALPIANYIRYVTLNTKLAPLDDINVRRAVVAAFNRDAMRLVNGGPTVAQIATHFITPGTPGYEEAGGATGPGYDFLAQPQGQPDLAAQYMRRAGFASGRYEGGKTILMVGVAGGNDERAAEVAQNVFQRLGFKVKLRLVSLETMATTFCGTPSARVNVCPNQGWFRDFADAQTMLDPTFNGDSIVAHGNSNSSELDVPAINLAMAKARLVVDPAQRARAWGAVDRMVTAEAAAVPLSWDRYPLVRSEDVAGVVNTYLAEWDPTFTWLR
jgi:peptide/nickel transport system substrate-binding protein